MKLEVTMLRDRAEDVQPALEAKGFKCTTVPVGKKHAEISIECEQSQLKLVGEIIDSI